MRALTDEQIAAMRDPKLAATTANASAPGQRSTIFCRTR
jgi:hypothetical protein